MASRIQDLSREVREVARMSGRYQSGMRDAVDASTRLSATLPGQPSAADAKIASALREARRHAIAAGQALDSFAEEADTFAARLADGTGRHPVLGGLKTGVLVGEILAVGLVKSLTGAAAPFAEIGSTTAEPIGGSSQRTGVERAALHTAAAVNEALDAVKESKDRADEISAATSVNREQTTSLIVDPISVFHPTPRSDP